MYDFDSRDWMNDEVRDDILNWYEGMYPDEFADMSEYEIDELVIDEVWRMWEDVRFDIVSNIRGQIVMTGHAGLWDGTHAGGSFFDDIEDFIDRLEYDGLETFTNDRGELVFRCHHHDGVNVWTVREVTEAGENYLLDIPYYEVDEPETIERVFHNDVYSMPVTTF